MATVKFEEKSPYQQEKRTEDHTDFKYKNYLEHSGLRAIHAINILSYPKFRLAYIVDADPERLRKIKEEFGLTNTVLLSPEEQDKVFNDSKVDGIIIATPTFTHESIVTKGLKAGKAVFCEKPISQNEGGTQRCYEVAKQVEKPLFCAFNRRYEPSFREVFNQVREGKVGRVHLIKTVSRDSPLPPIEYIKIAVSFRKSGALNDYDTVAITLLFPSGTIGMIDLSRNAIYGYDQRLEVFGPGGMVSASNEAPMQVTYSGLSSQSHPPIYHSFPSRYQEGYREELRNFHGIMEGEE
ncbi:Inositol 2-dehydrogenase [Armadillidium nasatum]|uniref:Inositol 2-dehydrogenase n=1 Tax=Armadillidium nasatum TaxID=96803 RepID=A0A5N5SX69_9CRUS|nr:Inositol 2-dehydrogenase [Armadillidium nasatum]